MMQAGKTHGLTLIETTMVLALLAIMLGVAFPPLQNLLSRAQATACINWLAGSIHFARHAAVNYGKPVTLCPAGATGCEGRWHQGTMAFIDHNQDRIINGQDLLLKRFTPPSEDITIRWRSFRNRQYLQLTPQGMTNYQNGNFVYCPGNRDLRFARQIVVSQPGRVRLSTDTNNDGYVEDRLGKHLRC